MTRPPRGFLIELYHESEDNANPGEIDFRHFAYRYKALRCRSRTCIPDVFSFCRTVLKCFYKAGYKAASYVCKTKQAQTDDMYLAPIFSANCTMDYSVFRGLHAGIAFGWYKVSPSISQRNC